MGVITKPYRGIQLNKTHPLARGLVGCWIMNEGIGGIIFDISGNNIYGSFSGATWETEGVYFNGVSYYIELQETDVTKITGDISVAVKLRVDDATDDGYIIAQRSGGDNSWRLWTEDEGRIQWTIDTGAPTDVNITPVSNGDILSIVGTWDQSNMFLYKNGVQAATIAKSGAMSSLGYPITLGTKPNGALHYFEGVIYYAYIWNRALSAQEASWFHRNPYAMFEQESRVQLLSVGAPPVGNAPTGAIYGPLYGPMGGPV